MNPLRNVVRTLPLACALVLMTGLSAASHEEIVVLRADYFESADGRFLSVEARNRHGSAAPTGPAYVGPGMSLSFNSGTATPIDSAPQAMDVVIDQETTPDTYIEHRALVRIGDAGSSTPGRPTRIRVVSSTGVFVEAAVSLWPDASLAPMASGYLKDFTTAYLDPTDVYSRLANLAAEFPTIAELIPLPYKTNGYQRRAQAIMSGTMPPGNAVAGSAQAEAVVLTSRAWGHEGGNAISAEFRHPQVADSPITVTVTGDNIVVRLRTDGGGTLSSTAAQVAAAINADPAASALVVAHTYRGSAGSGIVQPRPNVSLSDFLTTAFNGHVQRGPFQYSVLRIGSPRNPPKVGVFIQCQQQGRDWVTPLICLETAEQLLRNYATDLRTRQIVNNLDIFILPSSNPDGAHHSMHNFQQTQRNMTNHCVVGGLETDDPSASGFWTPRVNPSTGVPYVNSDPASRTTWGAQLNRNNTFGTILDGYLGASFSCTSDIYAGPAAGSEPEIKNQLWIADTFPNIKFSNNISSFGGYLMWAPGTHLSNRDEGAAAHPNVGVEKYFFEIAHRIVGRIKEHRGKVILPERTGPIVDVLNSAAGNSTDEFWYNRGVISFHLQVGLGNVGTFPDYATEGKHEVLEFAAGNQGLLDAALKYARDDDPPLATMTGPRSSKAPITTTFEYVNEPSVIRYTTDGSAPNESSTQWNATGPREPGEVFHVTSTTTFRWRATDIKGNVSTGSAKFSIVGK